jgi:hypothetical protein
VLALPLRHGHVLHGVEDATLLRITDDPIMAKFGLVGPLPGPVARRKCPSVYLRKMALPARPRTLW